MTPGNCLFATGHLGGMIGLFQHLYCFQISLAGACPGKKFYYNLFPLSDLQQILKNGDETAGAFARAELSTQNRADMSLQKLQPWKYEPFASFWINELHLFL